MYHSAELTVGFEMEQYTFTEPDSGVSVTIGTVCVAVADGSSQLGIPLNIQPLWLDGFAIGMHTGYRKSDVSGIFTYFACSLHYSSEPGLHSAC